MSKKAFRLCEVKNGLPYTLFHGVKYREPRRIKLNSWIQADLRIVNDNGTPYLSGFHTLETEEQAREYAQRFTPSRTIAMVPVEIRKWWTKPTNDQVILSEYMYLSRDDWTLRREVLVQPPQNTFAVNAVATMFNTLSLPGSPTTATNTSAPTTNATR